MVLMHLDLVKEFSYKILVKRIGFVFFVKIKYEKVPDFCHFCTYIEHSIYNYRRKENKMEKG